MSLSANVRSVDALKDVKLALIAYSEDARAALTTVDMEVRRVRDWLEREQLTYWKNQVKRREEEVNIARSDLHRRRLSAGNSDAISDTEQKEALRLAQRRLVEAEEKVATVKRWIPVFEHASAEYRAHSQPLGDHLAGSFENTLAALERMVGSLEAYLAINAPVTARYAPPGGSSDASPAGGKATTSAAAAAAPAGEPAAEAAAGETAPAGAEGPAAPADASSTQASQ
jgi:hypothetical protein